MNWNIRRGLLVSLFTLFAFNTGTAQYFSVGNDPASLNWRKMDYGKMSIIYPDYFESLAKELIVSANSILNPVSSSMRIDPDHFRSVIHPETIISNGWTMWVPRKLELSPMPSLYPMAEKYTDHLLIHELRHIAQLDKMDQGMTRVLSWFLGDQAAASVQAIQIPDWASEGDAVLAETLLSHSGRGRSPLFSQGMRALLIDSCNYRFDKARFGSYKDFVPNHYVFGYHLVSMARVYDGTLFWSDVWESAALRPLRIANFNRLLRKRTGYWQGTLFNKTTQYLTEFWKENSVEQGVDQLHGIIQNGPVNLQDYYNYLKPYAESDTSWLCLKTSYEDIPAIVRVYQNHPEELIIYTGSINGDSYSYSDGLIVWAQQIQDPRWQMRSYSDIFVYDAENSDKRRITRRQRYLYPVLNGTGTGIACIEQSIIGRSSIVVIDLNGNIVNQSDPGEGITFRQPVWSQDGSAIYAISSSREGKKLIRWEISGNTAEVIHDFGYKEVNDLELLHGGSLLFTAPIGTAQGLYAIDLPDMNIYKLISGRYGLAHPAVSGGNLSISGFTPSGYRPYAVRLDKNARAEAGQVDDLAEPFIDQFQRAASENPVVYHDPDTVAIQSQKYNKISNLFNFHSWAPAYYNIDSYMISPGAMVISQNDLNTLVSSFGLQYNRTSRSLDYFADLKYTGLYPMIDLNILAGKRVADSLILDRDTLSDVSFSDIATSARVMIPLFYSTGAYYQRLQPYFRLTHHRVFNGISNADPSGTGSNFDLSYATATIGFAGQVLRRMSYRDLFPRWGFTLNTALEMGITNPEVRASRRFSSYLQMYLPGFMKNHSIRGYIGYTKQDELGIPRLPLVSLPRGHYKAANYDYASFKLDYSFPVAYPDWAIPSVLYVTRFKANLFTDGIYSNYGEDPWSVKTGIDLTSNFYFLRINAEIEAGARIIFDPMTKKFDFEFLYSFDID